MTKNPFKEILSVPYSQFFIICIVVNLAVVAFIVLLRNTLPPVVPLLYGLPVGEEQLVPRILLIIPSLIVTFLTIVNMIIGKLFGGVFIQKVFVGLTIAISLLSLVTTLKIFFLVGSF